MTQLLSLHLALVAFPWLWVPNMPAANAQSRCIAMHTHTHTANKNHSAHLSAERSFSPQVSQRPLDHNAETYNKRVGLLTSQRRDPSPPESPTGRRQSPGSRRRRSCKEQVKAAEWPVSARWLGSTPWNQRSSCHAPASMQPCIGRQAAMRLARGHAMHQQACRHAPCADRHSCHAPASVLPYCHAQQAGRHAPVNKQAAGKRDAARRTRHRHRSPGRHHGHHSHPGRCSRDCIQAGNHAYRIQSIVCMDWNCAL